MFKIRWRLVLLLAMSGVLFGVLTVLACINGHEDIVALLFLLGVGKFTAFFERAQPVWHGFVAGFFSGIFALATQMIFADTYFVNNPEYLEVDLPFGLSPIAYTLIFSPIGGLLAGTISAVSALIVSWGLKKTIWHENT